MKTELPPDLARKIEASHEKWKSELDRIRHSAHLTLRAVELFETLIAEAEADPKLPGVIGLLTRYLSEGKSEGEALSSLMNVAGRDDDIPAAGIADLISMVKALRGDINATTGRLSEIEKFMHETAGFLPAAKADGAGEGEAASGHRGDTPDALSPEMAAFLAGQDYMPAQPESAHIGGGAGGSRVNEDVVGIPINERPHLVGLLKALDDLTLKLGRPAHSSEIIDLMRERKVPFDDMSRTWINTTLQNNAVKFGSGRRVGGSWWPLTRMFVPTDGEFFQQVTVPGTIGSRAKGEKIAEAYSALRTAQNLPPLKIGYFRGAVDREIERGGGQAKGTPKRI